MTDQFESFTAGLARDGEADTVLYIGMLPDRTRVALAIIDSHEAHSSQVTALAYFPSTDLAERAKVLLGDLLNGAYRQGFDQGSEAQRIQTAETKAEAKKLKKSGKGRKGHGKRRS